MDEDAFDSDAGSYLQPVLILQPIICVSLICFVLDVLAFVL